MPAPLKLLCVLAHPDDESLGTGGILAHYAATGVETYLITATRGERGWQGAARDYPGPEMLGRLREAELQAAAQVLGLQGVECLNYMDGDLDQADPAEAIAAIVGPIRHIRPQVIVTFGPDGATGHPDHIAISQFTTAAIICAADPGYPAARDWPPHRVDKLYYMVESQQKMATYEAIFGESVMTVDGIKRVYPGWSDWAITTRIDTTAYWRQVWQAIVCHRTQLPGYEALVQLPASYHRYLWGTQEFYRAYSTVNGGRDIETDLFTGLR